MRPQPVARMIMAMLVGVVGLAGEPDPMRWVGGSVLTPVEARVGRPATATSAAGVARRTTRRVVRRTSVYVASLPSGCGAVQVNGATLYSCGGVYYQPYGNQYVVVVVE